VHVVEVGGEDLHVTTANDAPLWNVRVSGVCSTSSP